MDYKRFGIMRMTRREKKVYLFLDDHCSASRRIRCSSRRIGLKYNLADEVARRILTSLEDKGAIELIQKGTGQRPNLWRVYRILRSHIVVVGKHKKKPIRVPEEISKLALSIKHSRSIQQVRSNTSGRDSLRESLIEENLNNNNNNNNNKNAGARVISLVDHVKRPPVKATYRESPFRRFRSRLHDPETWNAQDLICYYALLSASVRGVRPQINWRVESGAARNLLNRYEDGGVSVKRLLQLGFAITPEHKSPESLTWFTQHWVINRCEENWERDLSMPELRDDWVFANLS